jgi:UDP-N-acetylmuramyl pentapeptide phosphotransferase/UDP-N-acetylglucosamine-1-phosphate transferase
MIYISLAILFFGAMLSYFRIANHYDIIDKPNARSSHTEITIRGGGIVFLVAALTAFVFHQEFWAPCVALFIIGAISFVDDRMTVPSRVRILFHLLAVSIIFIYLGLFRTLPWWGIALGYVLVVGIINGYNFMDGINGMTGLYTLVILGSLQFVNYYISPFIEADIIWIPFLASIVFLYYNFRKKAKCFAGDVGSITMALWVTFLIISLILNTSNFSYILFLAVYGVDTILTIVHRLILKQNIFQAHRMHLYQLLVNERGFSHLGVSVVYGLLQLMVILAVIFSSLSFFTIAALTLLPLVLAYFSLKPGLMKLALNKL